MWTSVTKIHKKDFEVELKKISNYKQMRPYIDDMSLLIREEENGG